MKMLIAAVVLGLCAGAVSAQNKAGPSVRFETSTGPVTVNSVQPPLPNARDYAVRVADVDRNGDGYIQRSEIPEGHALVSEFRLVDSNRDGRISADELAGWK